MTLADSAIVLTIDRLGAGFLGPYGNTWIETPAFNRLASQSLLCETAVSDSPLLKTVFRSYWTGKHAASQALNSAEGKPSLMSRANAIGVRTILLTDDPQLMDHPLTGDFAERVVLPPSELDTLAGEIEETQFARVVQAAIDLVGQLESPYLLWIHARGMSAAWDAPAELRNQFAAEDDPLPGDFTQPPEMRRGDEDDPDELLKVIHAYAGQVTLTDLCLGALLDVLDELPAAARTMFIVTSPRGYPLGEHGRIGTCDQALYGELLQVPLLVRMPGCVGALVRTQEIVQPTDACDLLMDCLPHDGQQTSASLLKVILLDEPHRAQEIAVASAENQRAIRTPAWFLRESVRDGELVRELFAKPDDRWEVNEIASRGGEAPELLIAALDQFLAAARNDALDSLSPLPESLREVWR